MSFCPTRLTAVANADASATGDVQYASSGHLLIIGANRFRPAWLEGRALPGSVRVLVEAAADLPASPQDQSLQWSRGEVLRLEGWLGHFTAVVASGDPIEGAETGKSSAAFDLVIDCSEPRKIDAEIPPFGYFAVHDEAQFDEALARCRDLVGHFSKPRYFRYHESLCAHASFGQAGCTRCLQVCAASAIESQTTRIEVNPHLCQGCAACTLACPTGALEFSWPSRERLLRQLAHALAGHVGSAPTLIVHSASSLIDARHRSDGMITFPVESLASFGEELWFAGLALGAARVLFLADSTLAPRTRGLLEERIGLARRLLAAGGRSGAAIGLVESPEELSKFPTVPASAPNCDHADLSPSAGNKRALLNAALMRLLADARFDSLALEPSAPLGAIEINTEACTLCSACAEICPTGAIDYGENPSAGLARLSFAEGRCVQCGICAAACPEHAIRLQPRFIEPGVRASWQVVSEDRLANCPQCSRPFVPERLLAATLRRAGAGGILGEHGLAQLGLCPACRSQRILGPDR